jgi:hypothetical protein
VAVHSTTVTTAAAISSEQLQLLAVTENYLMETFKVGLSVVASS